MRPFYTGLRRPWYATFEMSNMLPANISDETALVLDSSRSQDLVRIWSCKGFRGVLVTRSIQVKRLGMTAIYIHAVFVRGSQIKRGIGVAF